MTSKPLVSRTFATLRSAEFGFFGVVVYTRVQTPRRCGEPLRAGVLVFDALSRRPLRTSCWMVGTRSIPFCPYLRTRRGAGHDRVAVMRCALVMMRRPRRFRCGLRRGVL